MRERNGHFAKLWPALAAGGVALLAAPPVLAQDAPPAASAYVPTTADYLAVTDVLQRYRIGVDKHDDAMVASAFWEDGVHIAVPSLGQEIRLPLGGRGGPPPPPPGQPGPGAGPPPGVNGGPPGPPPGAGGDVWHLPLDSYIHFESATRATHYGYFLSIYPEAEKPASGADMRTARTSIVGWPGHYEDVLEKRNGEWRILSRRSVINQK